MVESRYTSIFLDAEAPHQRFYGWQVAKDTRGLRVLCKRYGPVSRYLFLLSSAGQAPLAHAIADVGWRRGMCDLVVHDFDAVLGDSPVVAGIAFRNMGAQERLLNVATYVVDLGMDENQLFSQVHASFRRKIRRAEDAGLQVDVHDRPSPELLRSYFVAQAQFARSRGFHMVQGQAIEAMFASSKALLFTIERDGGVVSYLVVYTAGDTGFFLYGVNLQNQNDGAGPFLHWRIMCELKNRGLRWYDLGGVVSDEEGGGILEFKRRLGGQYVSLGAEYRHTGWLPASAYAMRATAMRWWRA